MPLWHDGSLQWPALYMVLSFICQCTVWSMWVVYWYLLLMYTVHFAWMFSKEGNRKDVWICIWIYFQLSSPFCLAKALTLYDICRLCNRIILCLQWLYAPVLYTILYHFCWSWPWLRATKSVESKACLVPTFLNWTGSKFLWSCSNSICSLALWVA